MSIGFGQASFGGSQFGYGTPSQVNSSIAKMWIKQDGTQGNSAMINPATGDYLLDANGNSIGADSVDNMVYLAIQTQYNSSTVPGFGLNIDFTNTNSVTMNTGKLRVGVANALAHLIKPGVISLVSVVINRMSSTGYQIEIKWRNLSTGDINILTL